MSKKKVQRPDISQVKRRLEKKPPPEPPPEPPPAPRVRPDTFKEAESFMKEYAELNAPQPEPSDEPAEEEARVDLGPLPEGVSAEATDRVFYRNTPIDNADVRATIESRCGEMDFADLVMTGRVVQDVPVLSGKLEVTFQSLLGSEIFWIERQSEREALTDWAVSSWLGYARLVLSLVAVNDREFQPYAKKREIDPDLFQSKFKLIMDMGEKQLELLLVNLNWFNYRVEQLYLDDFEQLKNG